MKFDFVIGNPPYQDNTLGENDTFAPPVYNLFMDAAYSIADKAELIHPARFLFNAGSTPKVWNQKMLNDEHFKVLYYQQDSSKIFSNTDIKGGVAITYHDSTQKFGAIEIFTHFNELNSIRLKAAPDEGDTNLSDIVYTQNRFDLVALYADYPHFRDVIGSKGKDNRFRNNIFDKIPIFTDDAQEDAIRVIGISKNKRTWKYISIKYVEKEHENLNKWKVLVPRANGSGAIGEVLSTPLVGYPLVGYTQSFIGFGAFYTENEALACMKYIKSKFARALLGILKITQDNDRSVWKLIPLQDFTENSDIDWTKSISEIDQQLYKKYNLTQDEINFIEEKVKEME